MFAQKLQSLDCCAWVPLAVTVVHAGIHQLHQPSDDEFLSDQGQVLLIYLKLFQPLLNLRFLWPMDAVSLSRLGGRCIWSLPARRDALSKKESKKVGPGERTRTSDLLLTRR